MTTSDTHRQTWETYATAWCTPTTQARVLALQASVQSDCVYRDPLGQAEGHQALIDCMRDFHRQVPGGFFRTIAFQSHHDRSLAAWQMCDAQGNVIGVGHSCGEYGPDGKLRAMTGFFELPSAPPATP